VLLALGIGSAQVVLDKGQQEDWLSSRFIIVATVIAAAAIVAFLVRELRIRYPVVHLRIFKDRTYSAGVTLMTVVGFVLYGSMVLLPVFLQTLLGYPALQAGIAMFPRGLGSFLGMPLVGTLIAKFDPRKLLGIGVLARLSQNRTSFSHAEGCTSRPDAPDSLDERSAGIQRPRSKILTDLRCSAVSSGTRITVARRPRSFVRTRTKVAFTSESVFIMLCTDFLAPSVRRTRLTNVKPITVAKVCNRKELSAHWCEGPQGATPPFFARRNSSSTFHCPRKACTIRPLLQT